MIEIFTPVLPNSRTGKPPSVLSVSCVILQTYNPFSFYERVGIQAGIDEMACLLDDWQMPPPPEPLRT